MTAKFTGRPESSYTASPKKISQKNPICPACCPFTHNVGLIEDVEEYLNRFMDTDDPEEIGIWKDEIVNLIETKGDNVNCIDNAGNSLLMIVIYNHVGPLTLALVTDLVEEYDTKVNYQNFHYNTKEDAYQKGATALHVAAAHGYDDIVNYLLTQGADRTLKEENQTPYDQAIEMGQANTAKLLRI